MKYFKYLWVALKNLIVLGISILILARADTDYERIVFSLLICIYLSIDSSFTWQSIIQGQALLAFGEEFRNIRKLLKEQRYTNSTLNAVFTEEEIASKREEIEESGNKYEDLFSQIHRKASEEIKAHHEAKKDRSSFEPSNDLYHMLKQGSERFVIGKHAEEDYQKMIKANLAVLNGGSLEEIEQSCKLHTSGILGLNRESGQLVAELISERKEYWQKCWDDIVEEPNTADEDSDDEFETMKAIAVLEEKEEEEAIKEANRKAEQAWIILYIKGVFISITFLVALWHLLKGLDVI